MGELNGYLEWGDVGSEKTTKTTYLWLKSGNKYKVRPLHKCVPVYKYFYRNQEGRLRTAICEDPANCPVGDKHPELQTPSERYAMYVIDREDGVIKVMEGPKTLFIPFKHRYQATKKSPGGDKNGSDWYIEVTGSGKKTKYICTYLEDTPLTASEKNSLQEEWGGEKDKLRKIYKPHTSEEIEQRLFGEWNAQPSDSSDSSGAQKEDDSSDEGFEDAETAEEDNSEELNMDW